MANRIVPDRYGGINIGKLKENLVTEVNLPAPGFSGGSYAVLLQRPEEKQPYPVSVRHDGRNLVWTVQTADTAISGIGKLECRWYGDNGEVAKSQIYTVRITDGLPDPTEAPEAWAGFLQQVSQDAGRAETAANTAQGAAAAAENAQQTVGALASQVRGDADKVATDKADAQKAAGDALESQQKAESQAMAAQEAATSARTAADRAAESKGQAETARVGAEAAQAKAEEAVQGVAADREQIRANTAGLETTQQDVTALKAENTILKAETDRTARSLDYLWKKSRGIIYDTEIVTGVGSSVTVPSGAMDYAALRKLGGMSRKGYQVLIDDFPGTSAQISVTKSGRYSYAIETLSDGAYQQSGKTLSVSGEAGQYTLHAGIVGQGGLIVRFYRADNSQITQVEIGVNTAVRTVNVSDNFYKIVIVFLGNTSKSVPIGTRTKISQIMLESGNTAHPWEPYTDSLLDAPVDIVRVANAAGDSTNTHPIPQTIRDMCPDYGQGTVDAYNYIDFMAKTYHHAGSMSQDGAWTALATPEVIDLSAVWPDEDFGVLRVEAGGTINLHYPALDDGYELAVPSETEIMVDVAKVVGTDG